MPFSKRGYELVDFVRISRERSRADDVDAARVKCLFDMFGACDFVGKAVGYTGRSQLEIGDGHAGQLDGWWISKRFPKSLCHFEIRLALEGRVKERVGLNVVLPCGSTYVSHDVLRPAPTKSPLAPDCHFARTIRAWRGERSSEQRKPTYRTFRTNRERICEWSARSAEHCGVFIRGQTHREMGYPPNHETTCVGTRSCVR
jgi:hypothetical protein